MTFAGETWLPCHRTSSSPVPDMTWQLVAAQLKAGHRCQRNYQSLARPATNKPPPSTLPTHVQPEDWGRMHPGHFLFAGAENRALFLQVEVTADPVGKRAHVPRSHAHTPKRFCLFTNCHKPSFSQPVRQVRTRNGVWEQRQLLPLFGLYNKLLLERACNMKIFWKRQWCWREKAER